MNKTSNYFHLNVFHRSGLIFLLFVVSYSTYNLEEIDVVADYIKMILASNKFKKKDIAVITPFKLQEKYIQKSLRQKKLSDVDVGTVQIFQGQEREVIILSTVRSRLLQHNGQVHIGFLGNQKVTFSKLPSIFCFIFTYDV